MDVDRYNILDKKTSVSNEVLANVLRGLLYNIKEEDVFTTVDNCFNCNEIYQARKILVKYFYDLFENEEPNGRFMGAKEREVKKDVNLCDIIEKMQEIVRVDHEVEFCVPWNYAFVVVSDEEKRFKEMVRQKDLEIDLKFQALEKVIESKNRETVMAVKNIINQVDNIDKADGESYIQSTDSLDMLSNSRGNISYQRLG